MGSIDVTFFCFLGGFYCSVGAHGSPFFLRRVAFFLGVAFREGCGLLSKFRVQIIVKCSSMRELLPYFLRLMNCSRDREDMCISSHWRRRETCILSIAHHFN
jgi:hypothetical protein